MGNACEAGRDGKGMEACEYCESLSLPAWDMDMGRGAVVLLCWGDVVMIGGRGGWLGFEVGEETTGGEVAGEDVVDMTVVIFGLGRGSSTRGQRYGHEHVLSWAMSVAEATAPNHSNAGLCPAPTVGSAVGLRFGANCWVGRDEVCATRGRGCRFGRRIARLRVGGDGV